MEYLDDLDYADDLAVLACTQSQIQEKTENVWQTARRVGLEINALFKQRKIDFLIGLDFEMSNLGIQGLENVSKKKYLLKKKFFFRKCFDCSKKFRKRIQLRS